MGARRLLGYGDAVVLLGGDRPGLAALDEALGGALGLATGGVSDTVLNLIGVQGHVVRTGRDILAKLRDSLGSSDRADRSQRIEAAHAVLVITAYFEALGGLSLPFDWQDPQLTRREQVALAGGGEEAGFVRAMITAGAPLPAPHLPYEQVLVRLNQWYENLTFHLLRFMAGLAFWDRMDETARERTELTMHTVLPDSAIRRYQELYVRLAVEVPEFGFWTGQIEHQATRASVRGALTGVESLLAGLSAAAAPVDVAAALSAAYRAALSRPILAEGDVPTGVRLPTVEEGYLDPRFRVRPVVAGQQGGPAEENWWAGAEPRDDFTEYLAGAFTGADVTTVPLVVLGQPGAGKSMLTRALAARLPGTGFLPVRVVLREVPAEAEVQDQIEYAIRAATGERATWPDLVRAAPGLVPVVLFDGFDELLQATGVSQSDFLVRVAQFQQREADQGRPVVALVTTRTAVADRARYPDGSLVLRLEPFDGRQVAHWLATWNRTNERYFADRATRPLPPAVAWQHHALASQPLLLLMLALYDASDNALQQGATPLDEAELYEDLLTAFATREVAKSATAPRNGEVATRVQEELQRLSLVAFGMLNRRRQWVTAAELDDDLAALLGRRTTPESGFRAPLDPAEIALGRFFFVQRAQAVQHQRSLATYEFLHATFGEYLAVRLAVQLLRGLPGRRSALVVGPAAIDDDLLYVLLSYAPLSSRQMLRFVRARIQKIPEDERARLTEVLVRALGAHALRTGHRHAEYRPDRRATSSRHGVYSANLVLFVLAVTGGFTASRLFPEADDPVGAWHRNALLWRSSMDEQEWGDFTLSLRLRHTWRGESRELEILPSREPLDPPEPVDPFWLYGYPGPSAERERTEWSRAYWDQLARRMDVSGGTNDTVVRHALEPFFARLGTALTTFMGAGEEPATSLAHDLIGLWLARRTGPEGDLVARYERCADWIHSGLVPDAIAKLVLEMLARDATRVPADVTADLVFGMAPIMEGEQNAALILSISAAALTTEQSADTRDLLMNMANQANRALVLPDESFFTAWVTVHDYGLAPEIFREPGGALLLRPRDLEVLPRSLRHQVQRVIRTHYPDLDLASHSPDPGPGPALDSRSGPALDHDSDPDPGPDPGPES
jgi:hypothetical protein